MSNAATIRLREAIGEVVAEEISAATASISGHPPRRGPGRPPLTPAQKAARAAEKEALAALKAASSGAAGSTRRGRTPMTDEEKAAYAAFRKEFSENEKFRNAWIARLGEVVMAAEEINDGIVRRSSRKKGKTAVDASTAA